jgi:tetratricopeptide (TPR) repeat protein
MRRANQAAERRDYPRAEQLLRAALAVATGSAPELMIRSADTLAPLHLQNGRPDEAQEILQSALSIGEAALGPEHLDLAELLVLVAQGTVQRGDLAAAATQLRRALAIRERALGPEHPVVGASLNNLAMVYVRQGARDDAELLYRRCLAIGRRAHGSEHVTVAATLHDLAGLYLTGSRFDLPPDP